MSPSEYAFAGAAFLESDRGRLLALSSAPSHLRQILEATPDLEQEYVRLFLNPAGSPCVPWQSAHEAERKLMGEAHTSALEWYARYGAVPAAGNNPADHVGLLLMFYAQLMVSGAHADELQRFSANHLSWIPEFGASVAAESRIAFYRELGRWVQDLHPTGSDLCKRCGASVASGSSDS